MLRKFLFLFDAETSHTIAMRSLQIAYYLKLLPFLIKKKSAENISVMNLRFPNRVGIAAGLDKNADYIDALSQLGFGFIEIGTLTPKPQMGNPKPRIFRSIKEEAVINRMGFSNKGIAYAAKKLAKIKYSGVLGINLGKNKDTPNDQAAEDYLLGFRALWKFASYFTINVSSPNTQGLRDLQKHDSLQNIICVLKQEQKKIQLEENKYIPLVVKISPDLSQDEIIAIAKLLRAEKIDGVIATNTTVSRDEISNSEFSHQTGGLSGLPLREKSTRVIEILAQELGDSVPIIASGGVMDAEDINEKLSAGASLVQMYTGLIYRGISVPTIINP